MVIDTSALFAILRDEPERRAFSRFGKGRHPAGLNYGDCFAYALAMARAEPVLYKGADFSKTDVVPAVSA